MTASHVIRIDATQSPSVRVGDPVHEGQDLCAGSNAETTYLCPTSGIVEEIRFEPAQHEFVVFVVPSDGQG